MDPVIEVETAAAAAAAEEEEEEDKGNGSFDDCINGVDFKWWMKDPWLSLIESFVRFALIRSNKEMWVVATA